MTLDRSEPGDAVWDGWVAVRTSGFQRHLLVRYDEYLRRVRGGFPRDENWDPAASEEAAARVCAEIAGLLREAHSERRPNWSENTLNWLLGILRELRHPRTLGVLLEFWEAAGLRPYDEYVNSAFTSAAEAALYATLTDIDPRVGHARQRLLLALHALLVERDTPGATRPDVGWEFMAEGLIERFAESDTRRDNQSDRYDMSLEEVDTLVVAAKPPHAELVASLVSTDGPVTLEWERGSYLAEALVALGCRVRGNPTAWTRWETIERDAFDRVLRKGVRLDSTGLTASVARLGTGMDPILLDGEEAVALGQILYALAGGPSRDDVGIARKLAERGPVAVTRGPWRLRRGRYGDLHPATLEWREPEMGLSDSLA